MTPGLAHLLRLQGIDNSECDSRHRTQDAHTSILSTTHLDVQLHTLFTHRMIVTDMSKGFSK